MGHNNPIIVPVLIPTLELESRDFFLETVPRLRLVQIRNVRIPWVYSAPHGFEIAILNSACRSGPRSADQLSRIK